MGVYKDVLSPAYNSRRKHLTSVNGRDTEAYKLWHGMIRRCYKPASETQARVYADCYVSEDWHDYQDFGEWHESNKFKNMGYSLDKDILVPNNKIYSPNRCSLVPREINILLTDSRKSRGEYPQGVSFQKSTNKFIAKMSRNGRYDYIGLYNNPDDAFHAYKERKEDYVKEMATKWRGRIDEMVYDALMNWELSYEL